MIFTSELFKEMYLNKDQRNYLDKEVLESINHPFYNLGGITSTFDNCINFISNFYTYYESLQDKFVDNKMEETSYEGCITFESISTRNQLIFPFFYSSIYENSTISENEINFFKNYLLKNHGEKEIAELLLPMMYVRDIPHELISKIFARIYTQNSSFYPEMNKNLMRKHEKDFQTFIQIMFEGLRNGSLSCSTDEYLYHGQKWQGKKLKK